MTTAELEWRLLFSMVVAGKSASFAEDVMGRLFANRPASPFEWVRHLAAADGHLVSTLRAARSGNYTKLTKGFLAVVRAPLDLRKCTPDQLEKIHGIGPKTARFFIIWTRPRARYAALDTHVLKWLTFLGHRVPRSTPGGKLYAQLEAVFIAEADQRKLTPRKLDALIWSHCSTTRLEWDNVLFRSKWPLKLHP